MEEGPHLPNSPTEFRVVREYATEKEAQLGIMTLYVAGPPYALLHYQYSHKQSRSQLLPEKVLCIGQSL